MFSNRLDLAQKKWHGKFLLNGESTGIETVKKIAGIVESAVFTRRNKGVEFFESEGALGERIFTFPSVRVVGRNSQNLLPFSVGISYGLAQQHAWDLMQAMFLIRKKDLVLRNPEFYLRSEYGKVKAGGQNNAIVFMNKVGAHGVERLIATNLLHGIPSSAPHVHPGNLAFTNCYSSANLRMSPCKEDVRPIYNLFYVARLELIESGRWPNLNVVIDMINEDNFTNLKGVPVNFDPVYDIDGF